MSTKQQNKHAFMEDTLMMHFIHGLTTFFNYGDRRLIMQLPLSTFRFFFSLPAPLRSKHRKLFYHGGRHALPMEMSAAEAN